MLPPELIAEIKRLELKARRLATSTLAGQYASAFHGRGVEFQEVREYVPGDDVRAIDWNVTARTGTPHIKVYREERELTIMLVVDVSASMGSGRKKSLLKVATELAAVLSWLTLRNHDRVGLMLFSDHIEHDLRPSKGRSHVWRLIKDLYSFEHQPLQGKGAGTVFKEKEISGQRSTNLNQALVHLQHLLHRRASVFVISDFWVGDFSAALKTTARQHDVTCVTLRDDLFEHLPSAGVVRWMDQETGTQLLLDTSNPAVRDAFAVSQKKRHIELLSTIRRAGCSHLELRTDESVVPPLANYLQSRSFGGKLL